MLLYIYVDDILITGNDLAVINDLKASLDEQFKIKDLGKLSYFLGIEFIPSAQGLLMTERKFIAEMLSGFSPSTGTCVSPMDLNQKLHPDHGIPLPDPFFYRRLIGKLNYLVIQDLIWHSQSNI